MDANKKQDTVTATTTTSAGGLAGAAGLGEVGQKTTTTGQQQTLPSHHPHKAEQLEKDPCTIARILLEKVFSMDSSMDPAHHLIKSYVSPSAKIIGAFPGQADMSRDDFRKHYDQMKHAMPDMNTVAYDMASGTGAEGKTVVYSRFIKVGRFAGTSSLYGLTPNHNKVEERGTAFFRFDRDNKIEFIEFHMDALEVLAYLGLNLYGKLPHTERSLARPQGLLGTQLTEGEGGGLTGVATSALATLPQTVMDAYEKLRQTISEEAKEGREGLSHLADRIRDMFQPSSSSSSSPGVAPSSSSSSNVSGGQMPGSGSGNTATTTGTRT